MFTNFLKVGPVFFVHFQEQASAGLRPNRLTKNVLVHLQVQ
jgi:hypothetical protein